MKPKVAIVAEDRVCMEQLRAVVESMKRQWELAYYEDAQKALVALSEHSVNVLIFDAALKSVDSLMFSEITADGHRQKGSPLHTIYVTSLSDAEHTAAALEAGVDDFVGKPVVGSLLIARIKIGLKLVASQLALRNTRAQLVRLNIADPSTGLFNKQHGRAIIDGELARVQRGKQQLSLMMLSLVNFGRVKGIYGEEAGSTLLHETASRLQHTSRPYDVLVRWSDEVLLAICPHTNFSEVEVAANRFRMTIEGQSFRLGEGTLLNVNANFGTVSTDEFPKAAVEQLLHLAEGALQKVTVAGSNVVAARNNAEKDSSP